MSGKYKLLCVILACVFAILTLPSCVGIGDGAMFDNITTGEKEETGVGVPGSAAFCQIYPGMSPGGTVTTNSAKALELHLRLSGEEYLTGIERDAMEKSFFELIYSGTSGKHYVVYSDDFVFEKVADTNSESATYIWLGKLTGAYDQVVEAYLDTLDAVTDEERDAGFKLNCLQVEMTPGISRTFILSDFEDIGGFYLYDFEDQPMFSSSYFPRESVVVYFKSCTPEELEEKIAMLKESSVVKSASRIIITYPDSK